jgi:BlaI family penicillinase repressor
MSPRKKAPPRVTDAELAVLEILWKKGDLSIRQLADDLYPGGGASEYSTVQKLLERLEAKGCVQRDRQSFVHQFRARVDRADVLDVELAEVAEKLCDGSLTPLLLHLVARQKLKKEDREALRKMLEEGDA